MTDFRHPVAGIGGGSGVGKSTLVHLLTNYGSPKCTHFPIDAYYRDLSGMAEEERGAVNFDHPDAIEHTLLLDQLDQLRQGHVIQQPVYDYDTHTRTGEREMVPRGVILVEGSLLFAIHGLVERLDASLFLDLTEAERKRRRLERDKEERGRDNRFFEEQFQTYVRPMHEQFIESFRDKADHRLDATRPAEALANEVKPILQELLRLAQAPSNRL